MIALPCVNLLVEGVIHSDFTAEEQIEAFKRLIPIVHSNSLEECEFNLNAERYYVKMRLIPKYGKRGCKPYLDALDYCLSNHDEIQAEEKLIDTIMNLQNHKGEQK